MGFLFVLQLQIIWDNSSGRSSNCHLPKIISVEGWVASAVVIYLRSQVYIAFARAFLWPHLSLYIGRIHLLPCGQIVGVLSGFQNYYMGD